MRYSHAFLMRFFDERKEGARVCVMIIYAHHCVVFILISVYEQQASKSVNNEVRLLFLLRKIFFDIYLSRKND